MKKEKTNSEELFEQSFDSFQELIEQIMEQGYDRETAGRYAVLIGDVPIADEAGNIIVMDGNREIARLKPLAMFE